MRNVFDPAFEDLPREIPVFPLHGCLLLPTGHLPLNIFEPRYLAMTRDALAGPRIIGMIQPTGPEDRFGQPELYKTGCAGRLVSFKESPDGRYLIGLNGMCRFDIVEELPVKDGYRRVLADYAPYADDMSADAELDLDRDRLVAALRRFFEARSISANWESVEQSSDAQLVTSLAMMCPFTPTEKQALLEAPSVRERAAAVVALLEMAGLEDDGEPGRRSH